MIAVYGRIARVVCGVMLDGGTGVGSILLSANLERKVDNVALLLAHTGFPFVDPIDRAETIVTAKQQELVLW